MDSENRLVTIEELAEETGVTPRNIRYYMAQGLLPPPTERGRYGETHRLRLRLIRRLTGDYVRLEKIKAQLDTLTDAEIVAVLDELGPDETPAFTQREESALEQARSQSESQSESAAAYIRRVLAKQSGSPPSLPGAPAVTLPAMPSPERARHSPSQPSPRHADASQRWEHIIIIEGVEIHVKTPLSPETQARIARLTEYARTLFETNR